MTHSATWQPSARKNNVLLCALWLSIAVSGNPTAEARDFRLPFASASQAPHPAVARVNVVEQGAMSHGTGTLVHVAGQHGLIVTNWHVVRDAVGEIEVEFPDGFRSAARVLKVDHDWDLAALQIWRPPLEPVRLAKAAPRPGDRLSIAGYGSGKYRTATGRCTQYVAPGAHLPYEMVELSAEARQGDSGGPIFNERQELAGVLFGASRGTTSGSYCGRVSVFLADVVNGTVPAANTLAGPLPPRGSRTVRQGSPTMPPDAMPGAESRPFELPPTPPPPPSSLDAGSSLDAAPAPVTEPYAGASPRLAPPIDLSPPLDSGSLVAPVLRNGSPVGGSAWSDPLGEPMLSPTSQTTTAPWQDLIGQTPFEQGKSVFAGIGILAVLLRLTTVLAGGRD